jgi:hypothetical protein
MAKEDCMSGPVGILVENDPEEKQLRFLAAIHRQLKMHTSMMRNYGNPVDEYEWNPDPVDITQLSGGVVDIRAAFSCEVRIESILAILPVGITSARLKLGERIIPIYNGPITTTQTKFSVEQTGIILNGSDDRWLSWTGTATSGYYVGLSGHWTERERG